MIKVNIDNNNDKKIKLTLGIVFHDLFYLIYYLDFVVIVVEIEIVEVE